ncbi:thioesterase II family protein [Streptomyces sp. NPDC059037]|uniref:thioesterase II family protein n=1 Tax=Streptomyces sp. NPDC059037 TaxID=3346710 RepID=UPI003684E23C
MSHDVWIAHMRERPRQPAGRVIVFPHSGAGPNALLPFVERLPGAYEVLGVTLPGRERRFGETAEVAPSELVAGLQQELSALDSCPTVFLGHSLGASIAVALALAEPALCSALLVSAQLPGGSQIERPAVWDEADLLRIVDLGGGTPGELLADPTWRDHVLQLLRTDLQLGAQLGRQNLEGVLRVPLTVLGGAEDRLVSADRLASWQAHSTSDVQVKILPGGHFYLLDPANADAVAAEISAALASAAAGSGDSRFAR